MMSYSAVVDPRRITSGINGKVNVQRMCDYRAQTILNCPYTYKSRSDIRLCYKYIIQERCGYRVMQTCCCYVIVAYCETES